MRKRAAQSLGALVIALLATTTFGDDLQIEALSALYNSTQGRSWLFPDGQHWDFSGSDICGWYGITCCAPGGDAVVLYSGSDRVLASCTSGSSVLALQLSGMNLTGALPPQIAHLQSLKVLDVSRNPGLSGNLSGSVLTTLSHLLAVDIRGTDVHLEGASPDNMPPYISNAENVAVRYPSGTGEFQCQDVVCDALELNTSGTVLLADPDAYGYATCSCLCENFDRADDMCHAHKRRDAINSTDAIVLVVSAVVITVVAWCLIHSLQEFAAAKLAEKHVARLKARFAPGKVPREWAHLMADDGRVTAVMTDVESSTALWEWDGVVMNHCIAMHDDLMRRTILQFNGYEVTTEGDAFIVVFHTAEDSILWAMHLQGQLLTQAWPAALASNPVTPAEHDCERHRIFNGLRVRVAMETGRPSCITVDQLTGRMLWDGPFISITESIADAGQGGQTAIGQQCMRCYLTQSKRRAANLPSFSYFYTHECKALVEWEDWHEKLDQHADGQARKLLGAPTPMPQSQPRQAEAPQAGQVGNGLGNEKQETPQETSAPVCPVDRQTATFRRRLFLKLVKMPLMNMGRQAIIELNFLDYIKQVYPAHVPVIVHMGEYELRIRTGATVALNVYQAVPRHLTRRLFHMRRSFDLGNKLMPSFFESPFATARLLDVPPALFTAAAPPADEALSSVVVAVCVCWPECGRIEKLTLPTAKRVVAAYSLAFLKCVETFGGYNCEKYKDTRVIIFPTVTAALSFASTLQRLLHEADWGDALELCALYNSELLMGPGVRMAIEVTTASKACLNPATGRIFVPGPYLHTLHALALVACPGQILLTDYAMLKINHELAVFDAEKHLANDGPTARRPHVEHEPEPAMWLLDAKAGNKFRSRTVPLEVVSQVLEREAEKDEEDALPKFKPPSAQRLPTARLSIGRPDVLSGSAPDIRPRASTFGRFDTHARGELPQGSVLMIPVVTAAGEKAMAPCYVFSGSGGASASQASIASFAFPRTSYASMLQQPASNSVDLCTNHVHHKPRRQGHKEAKAANKLRRGSYMGLPPQSQPRGEGLMRQSSCSFDFNGSDSGAVDVGHDVRVETTVPQHTGRISDAAVDARGVRGAPPHVTVHSTSAHSKRAPGPTCEGSEGMTRLTGSTLGKSSSTQDDGTIDEPGPAWKENLSFPMFYKDSADYPSMRNNMVLVYQMGTFLVQANSEAHLVSAAYHASLHKRHDVLRRTPRSFVRTASVVPVRWPRMPSIVEGVFYFNYPNVEGIREAVDAVLHPMA